MFVYPQTFFVAAVLSLGLFWLTPKEHPRVRMGIALGASVLLVFLASPAALAVAVALSVFAHTAARFLRGERRVLPVIAASIAIAGAIPALHVAATLPGWQSPMASIGIAYVVLKCVMVVVDAARGGPVPPLHEVFLLNLFFPIYSAGPIERAPTFNADRFAQPFVPAGFASGGARLAVGVLKTNLLADTLIAGIIARDYPDAFANPSAYSSGALYLFLVIKWLHLYVGFSGYTDIAVGLSRMFGIKVAENFNHPYLASNIQNYWQRWHMSMATFVSGYLFIPFVRRTGVVPAGLFLSFTLIGLWHGVSWNYLVWGGLHGAALAFHFRWRRWLKKRELEGMTEHPAITPFSRVLTLSYVCWVSMIGTSADLASAWRLTAALMSPLVSP